MTVLAEYASTRVTVATAAESIHISSASGICSSVNSNQGMDKVWAEVEAGLTTGKK